MVRVEVDNVLLVHPLRDAHVPCVTKVRVAAVGVVKELFRPDAAQANLSPFRHFGHARTNAPDQKVLQAIAAL